MCRNVESREILLFRTFWMYASGRWMDGWKGTVFGDSVISVYDISPTFASFWDGTVRTGVPSATSADGTRIEGIRFCHHIFFRLLLLLYILNKGSSVFCLFPRLSPLFGMGQFEWLPQCQMEEQPFLPSIIRSQQQNNNNIIIIIKRQFLALFECSWTVAPSAMERALFRQQKKKKKKKRPSSIRLVWWRLQNSCSA